MQKIDNESKKNSIIPLNIDNFTERYKTENGLFIFSSPSISIIEKHLFYLIFNSDRKQLLSKYKYKPSYLSFDEYGTIILDKFLMYVNGVMCIEDFDLEWIIIPKLSAINDILIDKTDPNKDISKLSIIKW